MRGKRGEPSGIYAPPGSIPAHAGETLLLRRNQSHCGVYPRTCGGNSLMPLCTLFHPGLSPHMRGKLSTDLQRQRGSGSIPAHAGETAFMRAITGACRVYPRTCGGNNAQKPLADARKGLSPHMRGKRPRDGRADSGPGSIPAHAGETHPLKMRFGWHWVYPRTCGGNRVDMHH